MPNLVSDPPALEPGTLRVIPTGGLGEIGRNMTVFEIDGKILIVDCGVLFPEENQPGVDLILPDFAPVRDRLDDIVGVVLTHGHEDHIGAVPYLLKLRRGHPADRVGAHAGPGGGEAQGAPHPAVHASPSRRGRSSSSARSRSSSSPSTTRSRMRSPSPSRRPPASCCTRATSRWTSCRSTTASPTSVRSRGSARRASTCSSPTRPTPTSPASRRSSAPSARCSTTSSPGRRAA